jgi:hypothetical protein
MRPLAYLSSGALGLAGVLASGACADLSNLAGGAPGDGGAGASDASLTVAISPASLDFGVAGCGTQVPPQTVNLENTGSSPILYEASLPEASGFALGGQQLTKTSGTVPPGGRTAFAITVASLHTLGALRTTLTIKIGDELREVPITVTGLGARLDVDHQVVDYGDVYFSASSVAQVGLSNPGTEDITIKSLGNLGTDFIVDKTTPLPLVVPKAGNATLKLDFLAGAAGAPLMRDITFETDDKPLCGDKPTLALRARRVNTDVTVNPGTIDFGKQPCGTQPVGQTVTVRNYGLAPATVVATTMMPSRYAIVGGSFSVQAAAGMTPGTATFTVQPSSVTAPVGIATESINVMVNGTARALTARIDPRGAILGLGPTFLSFAFVGQKRSVGVTNTGNENADTTYTSSSPAFTPGPGVTIFANGGNSNLEITYTPLDPDGIYMGTVTTTLGSKSTTCASIPQIDVETK